MNESVKGQSQKTAVGVIGLGIMGAPIALNLVKSGYPVTVYNRTASKCTALQQAGARVAASPAGAAAESDVVIAVVSDTNDVEDVLFGPAGAVEGLTSGDVLIDMSTINPLASQRFAARLDEHGVDFLDAPVSGGQKGAENATLAIMVGGKQAAFERCSDILAAVGKTVVHVGPNGHGLLTKMVNQVTAATSLVAMAECMHLIRQTGVDPEKALQVILGGAARSGMLENYSPKVLQEDFAPGFKIKLMNKDLRIASELLQASEVELPTFATAREAFNSCEAEGMGELGVQGVFKAYSK
ncbi:2-hydroxy-3-oxopropionate reductase [Posidoniimonas polymericola]|uniref:2-hydroxy-3-oxopropionate reductase n=2 Tax=Posidoniimonas polymericola TaxID=2528002 RepID=A0A5C5XWQ8_9BACT|nr:2-hydroxy-3-oxopropionate reductase [Posidoniimonas polymericola]